MLEKSQIRAEIRALKSTLTTNEKAQAANAVFTNLAKLQIWHNAKNNLQYYSLPDELQTVSFLEQIIDKNIFLPKVDGNNLIVLPYSKNSLQQGAFSIHEPLGDICINPSDLDLIIVPGIAYDKEMNRLGRGKGYYDKLLIQCNAYKIGVCYDFQLIDKIPNEKHDVKMDMIITPTIIIRK